MILELAPSPLMRVFCMRSVEVDCGRSRDIVDNACKAYLLWASTYPDYVPRLRISGRPDVERALNLSLFGELAV